MYNKLKWNNMQIAIASDHAGVYLKDKIINYLAKQNIKYINLGTNSDERVDYPDYAHLMIEHFIDETVDYGILICATGIGMSIAANRSSQIRAALCVNASMAEKARMHNDANILVLGSKLNDDQESLNIVEKFINTKFEGGRHQTRIDKIR